MTAKVPPEVKAEADAITILAHERRASFDRILRELSTWTNDDLDWLAGELAAGHDKKCPCHEWILARMDLRAQEISQHSPTRGATMRSDLQRRRARDAMQDITQTEPATTDYCVVCGESPESASHVVGPDAHTYVDPREGR